MKEVQYLADFNEDIENIKNPVKPAQKRKKFILKHYNFFCILLMCGFGTVIIYNLSNILLGNLVLSSILQMIGVAGVSFFTIKNFKNIRTIKQSEKDLLKLRKHLSDQLEVRISKKELENCLILEKEEENPKFSYKESRDLRKLQEEKIIRYFVMLDRDDQIQVLKYIKKEVTGEELAQEKQQLFLLENTDLEFQDVKRRLKAES